MRKTKVPYRVPVDHPGVYIGEEIQSRGWTQRDLAFILDRQEQVVSMIVSGRRDVNVTMAKALGAAFGVSADLFLNLQLAYNKSLADEPDESISRRSHLVTKYPLREMIKRGWIENAELDLLEFQIARFFELPTDDQAPHLRHTAKDPRYHGIPASQLAWLFRVRQLAKGIAVARYSNKKLQKAVSQMAPLLSAPEHVGQVPHLLNQAGVRFVVVECLPNGRIDGACLWLDEHSPVIGMTTRIDRIDRFWFVLRHEIEHVLQKDGQQHEVIDTEIDPTATNLTAEESRANVAARHFCAPREHKRSFFNGMNAKEKIRHHIAALAPIDGWGLVHP